jgi:hypothetical protein
MVLSPSARDAVAAIQGAAGHRREFRGVGFATPEVLSPLALEADDRCQGAIADYSPDTAHLETSSPVGDAACSIPSSPRASSSRWSRPSSRRLRSTALLAPVGGRCGRLPTFEKTYRRAVRLRAFRHGFYEPRPRDVLHAGPKQGICRAVTTVLGGGLSIRASGRASDLRLSRLHRRREVSAIAPRPGRVQRATGPRAGESRELPARLELAGRARWEPGCAAAGASGGTADPRPTIFRCRRSCSSASRILQPPPQDVRPVGDTGSSARAGDGVRRRKRRKRIKEPSFELPDVHDYVRPLDSRPPG